MVDNKHIKFTIPMNMILQKLKSAVFCEKILKKSPTSWIGEIFRFFKVMKPKKLKKDLYLVGAFYSALDNVQFFFSQCLVRKISPSLCVYEKNIC